MSKKNILIFTRGVACALVLLQYKWEMKSNVTANF